MQNDYSQFEQRKQDHIELTLMPRNQSSELNMFDHMHLRHEALPDLNFSDISLEGTRFGKVVPKPLLVSSMTAGHSNAAAINKHLIEACAQSGWAMGVGSQRRELTDKNASSLSPKVELWGSGGVRNGLDAAKLFALGVTTVGFAKPMLEAVLNSAESVVQRMPTIEYELKTALFCTGSATLAALKENACL